MLKTVLSLKEPTSGPGGVISAVVSNAELGKVTMGRKMLPLSANLAYR